MMVMKEQKNKKEEKKKKKEEKRKKKEEKRNPPLRPRAHPTPRGVSGTLNDNYNNYNYNII